MTTEPGAHMGAEMAEQPAVVSKLLDRRDEIAEAARALLPHPLAGVLIAARGSSDHAATFGRYVLQVAGKRPAALAAPSLHTLYRVPIDCSGYLCIGISQSGRTPEIVEVLRLFGSSGGRTLAITNGPDNPLAEAAERVIDLDAGPEQAVPATKTFLAQMVVLALIADGVGEVPWTTGDLERVPHGIAQVLDDTGPIDFARDAIIPGRGMIVAGRGFLFPAALEIALKLRETTGIPAEGYSTADLRHGPIAGITSETPLLVLSAGEMLSLDARHLVEEVRARRSPVMTASELPDADIPIPTGFPDALAAMLMVVRGQQLARAVALGLNKDPDSPVGLHKVTAT